MPFVPVANTAKVACLFTQYGQHLVNTLWFEKASAISGTDLNDLCVAINSWVLAEMLPNQSNSVTYNGSEAVDMTAAGGAGAVVPVTSGNTGGITGSPGLPSNVTAAVKFLTGLTGRSHRGRNYFLGLTIGGVTADKLETGVDALILGIYDALGGYLTSTAFTHVVASLYSGVDVNGKPIPRTAGVTTPVVSYAMDTDVDSMRRRLIGRGT